MKKKKIIFVLVILIGIVFSVSLKIQAQTRTIRKSETESDNLKLIKPTGVTQIAPTANLIRIQPGEYLVAKVGNTPTIQRIGEGKQRYVLPIKVYGVDSSGEEMNLDVVVEDEGGMRLDPIDDRFEGVLHIGLLDRDNPKSPPKPILNGIDLMVINEQGGIDPSGDLIISHTNLPFEPVTAHAIAPKEPVNIKIHPSYDPEQPVNIELAVIRPQIKITSSRQTIEGLGLGTAEINVRIEGFPNPEGRAVILETTKGGLKSTRLSLDNNGTATTNIRSIGTGDAIITASMTNADSAQATITFTTPWMFFLVAILGGLIGSLIKILQDKIKKGNLIIARLGLGILIAIVVAAAITVGVNLVGIAVNAKVGEAVIFVLSAIGAWSGTFKLPRQ